MLQPFGRTDPASAVRTLQAVVRWMHRAHSRISRRISYLRHGTVDRVRVRRCPISGSRAVDFDGVAVDDAGLANEVGPDCSARHQDRDKKKCDTLCHCPKRKQG